VPRVSSFELPISASHNHLLRVLPVVGCWSKTPTVDLPLTWMPCRCQRIKCPRRRSKYEGGGPMIPSSETETRSRGRSALDRGGALSEGGVPPPSEAESRSRGRPTLLRDGTSLEGVTDPRARRICTGAAPYPSSGAEFRPRVAGPIV
jgi:hypothetical protein